MLEFKDMFKALLGPAKAKEVGLKYQQSTFMDGVLNIAAANFILTTILFVAFVNFSELSSIIQLGLIFGLSFVTSVIIWVISRTIGFHIGKKLGGNDNYGGFMGSISYPGSAAILLITIGSFLPEVGGIFLGQIYTWIIIVWVAYMTANILEVVQGLNKKNSLIVAFSILIIGYGISVLNNGVSKIITGAISSII